MWSPRLALCLLAWGCLATYDNAAEPAVPARVCVVCMHALLPFFLALMAQLCAAHAGVELLLSFFFCLLFVCCIVRGPWVCVSAIELATVDAAPLLCTAGCIGGCHAVDAGPPPPACPSRRSGVLRRGALQTGGNWPSSVAAAASRDRHTEQPGGALFGGAFVPVALQSARALAVQYVSTRGSGI